VSLAQALSIDSNPFSDEFIKHINSKQSTWVAGRNFDEKTSVAQIRRRLGALKTNPRAKYQPTKHSNDIDVPTTFDARENWPECADVVSIIVDQSNCGSCWAVSAASAMSDRRCIKSSGSLKVPVSGADLMSCCTSCGYGCNGGYIDAAWNYWSSKGIVTGGLYNSSQGCLPYSFQPCDHHVTGKLTPCEDLEDFDTPKCTHKCTNEKLEYNGELTHSSGRASWLETPEDIQKEILLNGPVSAGFNVYADFVNYKSGVYQHVSGSYLGGHAIRILGWGEENGVPYWLIANSWNEDWGDKGIFKMKRGSNECGIEDEVYGAEPKL